MKQQSDLIIPTKLNFANSSSLITRRDVGNISSITKTGLNTYQQTHGHSNTKGNFLNNYSHIEKNDIDDVEDLEKWTFDMKRNQKLKGIKSINSYGKSSKNINGQKHSITDDKESTKLMISMVDTILPPKLKLKRNLFS